VAKDSDGGDEPSGKAREVILERRKFFIASALAGLAWSSCKGSEPQPCLSEPMVCLSAPPLEQPDASIDGGDDAGADQPVDAGAPANSGGVDEQGATAASSSADAGAPKPPPPPPTPPRPPPRPCLKMIMPPDKALTPKK
jgi:hypothetical protein